MISTQLQEGYEACRKIMQHHGKSYYFATSFFGEVWKKRSTWALYAFFRIPDDIVDEQPEASSEELRKQLDAYTTEWKQALAGESTKPVMMAIADTFARVQVPVAYGDAFLASMAMDIDTKQYATYADLEGYMYGSAGVVGYMMALVIGFQDARALEYAKVLGYAMQLTNFLRDIEKDYTERGRIYVPQDELAQFGLSVEDIAQARWSPQFRKFMQFQIARAWQLYDEGNKCLPLLDARGRFAYQMASVLYARILTKLEQQDCNPFAGRVSTSFLEKLWLLVRVRFGTV